MGYLWRHFGSILKPWSPHERPVWPHRAIMASQMGALGRQGCQIEPQSELFLKNERFFSSILDEKSSKSVTKYGIPFLGHIFQKFTFILKIRCSRTRRLLILYSKYHCFSRILSMLPWIRDDVFRDTRFFIFLKNRFMFRHFLAKHCTWKTFRTL